MSLTRLALKFAVPAVKLEAYRRYLFIGPHPDDIEIGAGATAAKLAAEGKDVDVLVGSDGKISAAHALGASGAIAGTANLITNVVVSLWRALEAGDAEAAASYQADVEPIRDVLHMGSTPQTLKRALELAGVPVGPARRPVAETTPGVDEKVRAMLDHYGIAHE